MSQLSQTFKSVAAADLINEYILCQTSHNRVLLRKPFFLLPYLASRFIFVSFLEDADAFLAPDEPHQKPGPQSLA